MTDLHHEHPARTTARRPSDRALPGSGDGAARQGSATARVDAAHVGRTGNVMPGAVSPAALLGIQHLAGNRAATGLVAQRHGDGQAPEVEQHRDIADAEGVAVQRNGEPHDAPPLSAAALTRANAIRGTAQARLLGIAGYNAAADRAIASYREKRTTYATRWGRAWERHNTILTQAGEQAATENLIEGVVIGAVASLAIAAAAAALFPAAATAAAFSATWWAFNAGTAVASSATGTGVATVVGRPSVPGPSAGRRDAEADAWQAIAGVEESARNVATLAPRFGLELGNAEYSIAQVQAHIDGGTTDMNWDQTLDMVSTLANWERGMANFDGQLDGATTGMIGFDAAIAAWEVPDIDRLEREIWYAWMAQLSDDEVLDQDTIQQYLVRLGLIPDYFYMSDEDQHRAVADARRHVAAAAAPPGGPT